MSTPALSSAEYYWLDDGISDSFKRLFKPHYRDAQQYIIPTAAPTLTPHHNPSAASAASYSYPGYLQRSSIQSAKSKLMKEEPPAILLPELLLDAQETEDTKPAINTQILRNLGSLASIWLAHSRQVGALIPLGGNASDTSSRDFFSGSPSSEHSHWYCY
jgi:hypothetical protein